MQQADRDHDEIAALAEEGRLPEATGKALALLNEHPQDSRLLFLLGFIFSKAENYGMAYQVLRRCVELAPKEAVAWHNFGKACYELRQHEHAETCWRRALQLDPKLAASLDGLGLIHLSRSEHEQCIEYCDRALAIEPTQVDTLVNRGMACLALGRWREGWQGYDANVGASGDRKQRIFGPTDKPKRWDGGKDQRVVVRSDQGIGDELSFASCLPDLVRDSKHVVIECDRRTLGIFKRSFPTCDVYGTRYDENISWPKNYEFDGHALVGELPRFYRNSDADFPCTPYLIASPELRTQFRALLDSMGKRAKIGIAWNGGRPNTYTSRRSLTLEKLLPVLKQDADFIALEYRTPDGKQKAEGKDALADEVAALRDKHGIDVKYWPWATQCQDYDVTLALLAELDLIITVTTTVVHAAGALGKPVWCLVPDRVMWRYGPKKFMWASSVELWRQRQGEWPILEMANQLDGWLIDSHGKRDTDRHRAASRR